MRNLLLLSMLSIVLVSFCVSNVQQASVVLEDNSQTDLYIKAEAIPTQVMEGRNLTMSFEVRNKRPDTIKNVSILAYDQCLFSGPDSMNFSSIRSNETKRWSWSWSTGNVNYARDCKVSFRAEYDANFSRTQSLPVLTESEFNQRDSTGTLNSIPFTTDSTSNPIDIILSFSKTPPFIENEQVTMFIDYVNKENGFIDTLNAGDVNIAITNNMGNIACNDYGFATIEIDGRFASSRTLSLNRNLKFIGGRASRSTCTFTAGVSTQSPVDIETLTLTANYKYVLDNSLTVKVIPS